MWSTWLLQGCTWLQMTWFNGLNFNKTHTPMINSTCEHLSHNRERVIISVLCFQADKQACHKHSAFWIISSMAHHGSTVPLIQQDYASEVAAIYSVTVNISSQLGYWYSILYILGINKMISVTSNNVTCPIKWFLHEVTFIHPDVMCCDVGLAHNAVVITQVTCDALEQSAVCFTELAVDLYLNV